MKCLNVEIKAKCNNHKRIRSLLQSLNAEFNGIDHQIDTYFRTNNGRLKLRQGNIENHLIFYQRENKKGPKQSNIILFKSDPNSNLKEILLKSLGSKIVVDKLREIYFIDNVKFHLDKVKGLGTFIEIEAIDKNGHLGTKKLLAQCNKYLRLFRITDANLISDSYSDLLLKND